MGAHTEARRPAGGELPLPLPPFERPAPRSPTTPSADYGFYLTCIIGDAPRSFGAVFGGVRWKPKIDRPVFGKTFVKPKIDRTPNRTSIKS